MVEVSICGKTRTQTMLFLLLFKSGALSRAIQSVHAVLETCHDHRVIGFSQAIHVITATSLVSFESSY